VWWRFLDEDDELHNPDMYYNCPWYFRHTRSYPDSRALAGDYGFTHFRVNDLFSSSFDYPFYETDVYSYNMQSELLLDEERCLVTSDMPLVDFREDSSFEEEVLVESSNYSFTSDDYFDPFINSELWDANIPTFLENLYDIREPFILNQPDLSDEQVIYFLLYRETNFYMEDYIASNSFNNHILTPIYDVGGATLLTRKGEFYKGCMLPVLKLNTLQRKKSRFFYSFQFRVRGVRQYYHKRSFLRTAIEPELFTLFFSVQTTLLFLLIICFLNISL